MNVEMDKVVEQVLAGEIDAFAEIVRMYQQSVWQIMAYALRDRDATEDLVQQVFVAAYRALDTYETGRDLGKWINAIARNTVRQEIRRRVRESKRLKYYEEQVLALTDDGGETEARREAMKTAMESCRELLSLHSAEAFRLRYDLAMGFEEVARQMGRTVEATRMLLSRVRENLRLCVERRMVAP